MGTKADWKTFGGGGAYSEQHSILEFGNFQGFGGGGGQMPSAPSLK